MDAELLTPTTEADCPPGDLACLLKVLQNAQNGGNNLTVVISHCEQFYWGALSGEYKLPDTFNPLAPQMIAALHKIEVAALEFQQLYRKGFGYRGQGLPAGQT